MLPVVRLAPCRASAGFSRDAMSAGAMPKRTPVIAETARAKSRTGVEGGAQGLVKFIKNLPPPASDELGTEMKTPPAYIVAEGDLVTFVFKRQMSDPKDKSKTFEAFTFDMFRIKNGKIVEHWDNATR